MNNVNPEDLKPPALVKAYYALQKKHSDLAAKCLKSTDPALQEYVKNIEVENLNPVPPTIVISRETIHECSQINANPDAGKAERPGGKDGKPSP
jgi:hypothetical protein